MTEEKFISGPPGLNLPDTSLGEFILDKLTKSSLRIIQVDAKSGQILTSHELLEKSVRLAVVLGERGIKCGDTIAISSESNCDWFVAVCGALFRGVCVAPMNPAYLEDEINHCLNISKPRIIFVSQKTASIIHSVVKKLSWNIELIQFDDAIDSINIPTLRDIIGKPRQWPDSFFYKAEKVTRPAEKECVILNSSGTTGLPKGVMLSHRNMLAIIHAMGAPQFFENWKNSSILFLLPFFHGYGLATMLEVIIFGGTAIVMQGFNPQLFCTAIQKYRIEYLPLVPPIMVFLAKHPMVSSFDFSSIKEIICGAAPLPREILNAVQKRFNDKIVIRNGYGMTELSVAISISTGLREKPDTVGPLFPGTQCKVIDPTTSKSLAAGESGELCFKGDHIMLGYKNNYEETRDTIDKNGWLHTGDLGYYDNDGEIYVVGRLKELIKYNGFQISPSEIESYLLKHPDVIDAAVIGKDDENCGQIPVAFVVKRPESTVTADELRLYIDERVSSQKRLRGGVKFIAAIPKNSNGKILRKELEKFFSKL